VDFIIGTILLFPYTFIPENWLPCDGRALSVAQYQALYALIGNTYGGNTQNFNLPDLRGAKPHDMIQYYIAVNGIFPTRS